MHSPETLVTSFGPFSIWHHDPCKKGRGDDSCGWFMRAHHGDPAVLAKIEKAIAFDFDRVFKSDDSGTTYHMGLFCPNGDPNFSVQGIVMNMFFDAIHVYYGHNWRKSRAWMRANLFDILMFAENPTDSLRAARRSGTAKRRSRATLRASTDGFFARIGRGIGTRVGTSTTGGCKFIGGRSCLRSSVAGFAPSNSRAARRRPAPDAGTKMARLLKPLVHTHPRRPA